MCLYTISNEVDVPEPIVAFKWLFDDLSFPCYPHIQIEKLGYDKWVQAQRTTLLTDEYYLRKDLYFLEKVIADPREHAYSSGFHCFTTREDAEKYKKSIITRWLTGKIFKVLVKGHITYGQQSYLQPGSKHQTVPALAAEWMCLPSIQD